MMRRNLTLVLTLALLAPAMAAAEGKRRRLDQLNTTKDRWDELMNSEQIEDDKPKREVIRLPARAPAQAQPAQATKPVRPVVQAARPAVAKPQAARLPASAPPVRIQPQAVTFPVAAISFDEYLIENGRNPALSKAIPDHQVAFTDLSAPAVITIPGSESANAQAAAQPGAVNPATAIPGVAGATNPAALQNAAAAAAAAGLIPAGSFGTVAPGGAAPGAPQTQTTGAPIR